MTKIQKQTPEIIKKDRILQKTAIGYYVFISNNGYVFRDGTKGQYIIINRINNLLIIIMATEKDMKKVTRIFREML